MSRMVLAVFAERMLADIDVHDISYSLLMALKHKAYRVYMHSLHVAYGSYLLATALGWPEAECWRVARGGFLHDIGKLNISPKILYKPERLADDEWQIMQRHMQHGINLLQSSVYYEECYSTVLYHHERYDGQGYDKGVAGERIPLPARIVSLCDAFDAMVSFRSYKETLSLEAALAEIAAQRGKQFDPAVSDAFMSLAPAIYRQFGQPDELEREEALQWQRLGMPDWDEVWNQIEEVGLIYLDRHENICYCNEYAAQLRDLSAKQLIGQSFYVLHKPHRAAVLREKFQALHQGRQRGWKRVMARHGRYLENRYLPIWDERRQYSGVLLVTSDVTEREQLLRNLTQDVERLNLLLQVGQLLAKVGDVQEIFLKVTGLLQKMWPVHAVSMLFNQYRGERNVVLGNSDDRDRLAELLAHWQDETRAVCLVEHAAETVIVRRFMGFKTKNAGIVELVLNGRQWNDSDRQLLAGILNSWQVAVENHLLFVDLQESAVRDQLTGLYNRHQLAKMEEELAGQRAVFIIGDINDLKQHNDRYGHASGDVLICGAADILRQAKRRQDLAFRIGGDEFLLIMPGATKKEGQRMVERMQKLLKRRQSGGMASRLSLSLGYAASAALAEMEPLIAEADARMYQDKQESKAGQLP